MKDHTIPSRQDFIEAVEVGIKAAGDKLSEARIKRLRHYAQTATSFACGTWNCDGIPCPFAAIGGSEDDPGAKEFARAYDPFMREIIGYTGAYMAMRPGRSSGSEILSPLGRGILPASDIGRARANAR